MGLRVPFSLRVTAGFLFSGLRVLFSLRVTARVFVLGLRVPFSLRVTARVLGCRVPCKCYYTGSGFRWFLYGLVQVLHALFRGYGGIFGAIIPNFTLEALNPKP